MRRRFFAMLVGAALAGCAEEPANLDDGFDGPSKPDNTTAFDAAIDEADLASPVVDVGFAEHTCEPMADDGPCALVCDPEALVERYVPEGTCVHFLCTARDGTRHNLGACR